ncbi:OLC1v1012266C1 [Oldenlandia corymbosa var. corymbosa]|uniref:OLC1v1012266C1 n=1 Tax=Oldenlandia corymbosa var. corymbosa TaxID=529605 RepID=A0AAV1DXY8_OLDCO|nr:OLC1v1012266C1 [Oldenlandia corymbosa var. corymbosa]
MVSSRKKSQCTIGSMLDLLNEPATNDSDDEQNANNNDPLEEDTIGRGPTRQGFRWGTGEKMILELNDDNQVVGSMAAEFATQLGVLAKEGNKLPLIYTDWRALPKPMKDDVWAEVKATLKALKQQLPPELQDDIEANNKIFEDVIRKDAPGCLRSCKIVSKSKKVFTSQQEFDRAVDERVASIQHNLEIKLQNEMDERLSKMKDDWLAEMKTMMQDQSSSFGSPNTPGNSSNNGQTNQSTKVSKEINQSKDDNPPLICSDATSTKEIQKVT